MPSSTTPHMPGAFLRSVASTMWQLLVPMMIVITPGSMACAAGGVACASTLATATAVPGRKPVQPAASSVSPPAFAPRGRMSRLIFVSTTSAKSGLSAAK